MTICRYHCRACEHHFTSLVAFDNHRQGGVCLIDSSVLETKGTCKIGDPDNVLQDVSVYELPATEEYRKKMSAKS